jgi:glucosamine--fructose-6-phosphate aminotransferase (isomerizing)
MCGIFGIVSNETVILSELQALARHARQRGKDSSGLIVLNGAEYSIHRADYPIDRLLRELRHVSTRVVMGHSRLITNGLEDNQPVVRDGICVLHNGIVVNHEAIWERIGQVPRQSIDTEVIAALVRKHLDTGGAVADIPKAVLSECRGIVACAVLIPALGSLCLFSNNGSLYVGEIGERLYFASERFPLTQLGCSGIVEVREGHVVEVPKSEHDLAVSDRRARATNLIPALSVANGEEKLLVHRPYRGRRCTRCILPETMPYISFDVDGVCNYCLHYKPRNTPRPKEQLFRLVEPYRRPGQNDCIVPFSGGRDSCYGLHLIVKELGMRPITYTYDWGMVTDLGRRNISRMCAELGVENIIVADDIQKKRENIAKNVRAWMKAPHLGMVSMFTAGDKHFFRHVETVKAQTGISLNLWGVNPLEVTHFKAGFLGVPPDFEEKRVYSHGVMKQLRYQNLRLRAMLQSPGYFNTSLWDTLSGEYYRSFTEKGDYFHIFDFWRWDEKVIEDTLDTYEWERAPDTRTTWRIGDGTAAFYNYIYYTVAGFTEHDTFRSNQVREGQLTRAEALALVDEENEPRYPNLKWYIDAIGLDFSEVIKVINNIPRMF